MNAGKGQGNVGDKFPNFPETRSAASRGTVGSTGKMPSNGVKGGKTSLGGSKK